MFYCIQEINRGKPTTNEIYVVYKDIKIKLIYNKRSNNH